MKPNPTSMKENFHKRLFKYSLLTTKICSPLKFAVSHSVNQQCCWISSTLFVHLWQGLQWFGTDCDHFFARTVTRSTTMLMVLNILISSALSHHLRPGFWKGASGALKVAGRGLSKTRTNYQHKHNHHNDRHHHHHHHEKFKKKKQGYGMEGGWERHRQTPPRCSSL